ncbi:hypothetical protein R1flu_009642 [Riccia fluitans]|uniref:Leucine-rich repeat-containing N-terminal plant-type domain-containing protein n=1 Tax=Riccia fluitans TaxID=41844 RepID=A0ABD1Z2V7_9MARC
MKIVLLLTSLVLATAEIDVQSSDRVGLFSSTQTGKDQLLQTLSQFHNRPSQLIGKSSCAKSLDLPAALFPKFPISSCNEIFFNQRQSTQALSYRRFNKAAALNKAHSSPTSSSKDGEALLEFRKGVTADPYQLLAGWNSGNLNKVCTWHGVTCGQTGRVVSLVLTGKFDRQLGLSDILAGRYLNFSISPSLCNVSMLQELDLSDNFIDGVMPQELGRLEHLTVLRLRGRIVTGSMDTRAMLSGSIPQELGQLQNLEELDLARNALSGSIPSVLSNCSKLFFMALYANTLTGPIPEEFGQLERLQILLLENNHLSAPIPPSLGNCSNLFDMNLHRNTLTGPIPEEFGQLEWLMHLSLMDNNLSAPIPPSLGNCSKLVSLGLSSNNLIGPIPEEFGQLERVRDLVLDNNQLTGEIPPFNLTELSYLWLGNNRLSGEIPLFILPNLIDLNLAFNHLTGSIPVSFYTTIPNLTFVDLSHNNLMGINLSFKLQANSLLESLDLSYNKISGSFPWAVMQLKNLKVLSLANNFLSGGLVLDFGDYANCSLQFLSIAGNNFSGIFPGSIQLCQELKVLDVSRNRLSGRLPLSASNAPQLIVLQASSNKFEGEIPSWVWQLEQLQILDLSDNNFHGGMPLRFDGLLAMKGVTTFSTLYIGEDGTYGVAVKFNTVLSYKGAQQTFVYFLHTFGFISLSGNGLSGIIPPGIGNLTRLKSLNVSRNELTGVIPATLGQMKALESLDLSDNYITGSIPQVLLSMNSLGVLNLSRNNLSGPIPSGSSEVQTNTLMAVAALFPGNEGLCGQPSNRSCAIVVGPSVTPASSDSSPSFLSEWISLPAFSVGFGLGYCVVGLMLLFSKRFRYSFVRFPPFPRALKPRKPISYGIFRYQ